MITFSLIQKTCSEFLSYISSTQSIQTSFFHIIHLLCNPTLNNFSFAGQTNDRHFRFSHWNQLLVIICQILICISCQIMSIFVCAPASVYPSCSHCDQFICRSVSEYFCFFILSLSPFFGLTWDFAKIVFNQCLAILNCYEHIRPHSILQNTYQM